MHNSTSVCCLWDPSVSVGNPQTFCRKRRWLTAGLTGLTSAAAPLAPCWDVPTTPSRENRACWGPRSASNSTQRNRANQPGSLFSSHSASAAKRRRGKAWHGSAGKTDKLRTESRQERHRGLPAENQHGISGSRKTFISSSAVVRPSGKAPRLYSAIRFFHLRKSVMLCGSILTSTRRRLASSRFIS